IVAYRLRRILFHESPRHADPPIRPHRDQSHRLLVYPRDGNRQDRRQGGAPPEKSLRRQARSLLSLRGGDPSGPERRLPHSQRSPDRAAPARAAAELSPDPRGRLLREMDRPSRRGGDAPPRTRGPARPGTELPRRPRREPPRDRAFRAAARHLSWSARTRKG